MNHISWDKYATHVPNTCLPETEGRMAQSASSQQLNLSKSCSSCRHILEKSSLSASSSSSSLVQLDLDAQLKDSSSFLIVPALETIVSFGATSPQPQQKQFQLRDNDPSPSSSSSSSSPSSAGSEGGGGKTSQGPPPPSLSSSSFLEQVSIVKCTSCDKSVALLIHDRFQSIEGFLFNKRKANGWEKVEGEEDRLVLFILNQIIYREYEVPDEDELQVEYALPPQTDLSKVLWVNGNAVGFYSVKRKGTLDVEAMECYSMPVLDTLFIRNSERRKGYALTAIQDVLFEFPDENIGFSVPISLPMIKVLKKHLELHPADRMKLWEVAGAGSEGNCRILWFLLKKS